MSAEVHDLVLVMRSRGWRVWAVGRGKVAVRPPKSEQMPARTRIMRTKAFRAFVTQKMREAA